ncbi:hypothetical protein AG1IA_09966 [Rhizoctonia solani AG-1 IA]|uniref:Uncharacterized protein n=1 Tax=Thanatephorus cucumeris (strain AG1-IA) TaxID=983506 RepID=L8WHZ8_THACA|nr:hypothetical protein AG1IA_09966 [Rhizoctonia solani AG-1 IA]
MDRRDGRNRGSVDRRGVGGMGIHTDEWGACWCWRNACGLRMMRITTENTVLYECSVVVDREMRRSAKQVDGWRHDGPRLDVDAVCPVNMPCIGRVWPVTNSSSSESSPCVVSESRPASRLRCLRASSAAARFLAFSSLFLLFFLRSPRPPALMLRGRILALSLAALYSVFASVSESNARCRSSSSAVRRAYTSGPDTDRDRVCMSFISLAVHCAVTDEFVNGLNRKPTWLICNTETKEKKNKLHHPTHCGPRCGPPGAASNTFLT